MGNKDMIKQIIWVSFWISLCIGYGLYYQFYQSNKNSPPPGSTIKVPPTTFWDTLVIDGKTLTYNGKKVNSSQLYLLRD